MPNYLIGVMGGPVMGKSTFANYLKDVLFKSEDVRVISTGAIAKNKDEVRHGSGELGPEIEIRREVLREVQEAIEHEADHIIVDASPRVVGQISFLHAVALMTGLTLVICELHRGGKQSKYDHLFSAREDGLIDPDIHEKRWNWWNNNLKYIKQERDYVMPCELGIKVTYPNGATHVVSHWFENERDQAEWVDSFYAIETKEEPEYGKTV